MTLPMSHYAREDRRAEQLEGLTKCPACLRSIYPAGFVDPEALVYSKTLGDTVCKDCDLVARGALPFESHHWIGKALSDFEAPIFANLHDFLSERMRDWPEILRRPTEDPLLILAAIIRSLGDLAEWVARHAPHASDWLISQALLLREQIGTRWWEAFNFPRAEGAS